MEYIIVTSQVQTLFGIGPERCRPGVLEKHDRLGHGEKKAQLTPNLVETLVGAKFYHVSSGNCHTAVYTQMEKCIPLVKESMDK